MHFANSSLLITFAYILVFFELDKGRNEDGTVIEPSVLTRHDPDRYVLFLRWSEDLHRFVGLVGRKS
jgi:hypothetical protein